MNKDIFIGNKIIYQKMHRKQRLRHLNKLTQIKTKPSSLRFTEPPFFKHPALAPDSQKHLQVERNNIALFNRIATIIKEKPKVQFPKTRSFVQSLDQAMYRQQKKMHELKLKNENLAKRLNKQQPTIKNELLLKDRVKHERYLSFIGKYPFRPFRRTHTQFQISNAGEQQDQREQLYHQRTLDFEITIMHRQESGEYVFRVRDLADEREYVTVMGADKFREQFAKCEMRYERMVGRLRMEKNGEMRFVEIDSAVKIDQSIVK